MGTGTILAGVGIAKVSTGAGRAVAYVAVGTDPGGGVTGVGGTGVVVITTGVVDTPATTTVIRTGITAGRGGVG